MHLFIKLAACGINVFGHRAAAGGLLHRPPLPSGFVSVFVMQFVAQQGARPVRARQPKLDEGLADVEISVFVEGVDVLHRCGESAGAEGVVRAGVVVVAAELLEAGARETLVRLAQIKRNFVVIGQCVALDNHVHAVGALLFDAELGHATAEAAPHPLMFLKLARIAADRHVTHGGRERELRLLLRVERVRVRVFPRRALINPGAEQGDLVARERVALALGRHFHLGHQPRHVMNERTSGAVAGQDVPSFAAATQRRLARGEREAALGFFRAVAAQARGFKDRLDVAHEIYGAGGGGRQLGRVNLGSGDSRGEKEHPKSKVPDPRSWAS